MDSNMFDCLQMILPVKKQKVQWYMGDSTSPVTIKKQK